MTRHRAASTHNAFPHNEDSRHRWPGTKCRAWLERITNIYDKLRGEEAPTIKEARRVLFDATSRTSEIERILIGLIDHQDPAATELLEHRAMAFDHERLTFVHHIATQRRRRYSESSRSASNSRTLEASAVPPVAFII